MASYQKCPIQTGQTTCGVPSFICVGVFSGVNRPIFALNGPLQIEQVNSENDDSDDDPLALALCSVLFLSASQILFGS